MAECTIPSERHAVIWQLHARSMALSEVLERETKRNDQFSMMFAVPQLLFVINELNQAVHDTLACHSEMSMDELRNLAGLKRPVEVPHG